MKLLIAVCGALLLNATAGAQQPAPQHLPPPHLGPQTLPELVARWGIDLERIELTTLPVRPGLHAVFGAGGTALVSVGDQGVLLVDDKLAQAVDDLEDIVQRLGGETVDFVLNTHWHFDHADGNPKLGAKGARIVAHENSDLRMKAPATRICYEGFSYLQPPYPPEGLPVVTFNDRMTIHFNGHTIDLIYFGPGHTAGDAIVVFREANVAHLGDLFGAYYPTIDAANGGTLKGLIHAGGKILKEIDYDTSVISGHSSKIDGLKDFEAYLKMLETVWKRLQEMVDEGYSLDEVIHANRTKEFDGIYGSPSLLLETAYRELTEPESSRDCPPKP